VEQLVDIFSKKVVVFEEGQNANVGDDAHDEE